MKMEWKRVVVLGTVKALSMERWLAEKWEVNSGDKKGQKMGSAKAWMRAAMLDFATASQLGKLVVVSRDTVMAVQSGSGWEEKRV